MPAIDGDTSYRAGEGPILVTFSLPRGDLVAWCDRCGRWQLHGAGDGHREPHCGDGAGYSQTGYQLLSRGPALRTVVVDVNRRRQLGPVRLGLTATDSVTNAEHPE